MNGNDHHQQPASVEDHHQSYPPNEEHASRLQATKSKVKTKAKDLFARGMRQVLDEDQTKDASVTTTVDDPAFKADPGMEDSDSDSSTGAIDKMKRGLKTAATTIAHPKQSAQQKTKSQTAAKVSLVQNPRALPTNGTELLEAYDENDAISIRSADESISDLRPAEDDSARVLFRKGKQARFNELENRQESMRMAWATEHVDRVKSITDLRLAYPKKHNTISAGSDDLAWLGAYMLWFTQDYTKSYIDDFDDLPFSIPSLRDQSERILMATVPLQSWLMDIRSIYRWDEPVRTGCWMAFFLFLWHVNCITVFLLGSLIYQILYNRIYPQAIPRLRASLHRSSSPAGKPLTFAEFIDRYGRDGWVDPLLEQMGPYLQLQIQDLANLFEVLSNFYTWCSVKGTSTALALIFIGMLMVLFTPVWLLAKTAWLATGAIFFLCWPIASHHPQYRLLVSPFTWLLRGIPTHAEEAFHYLRANCDTARAKMAVSQILDDKTDPTASTTTRPQTTFLSYPALHANKLGTIALTPDEITFTTRLQHKHLWSIPYSSIVEMRKYKLTDPADKGASGDPKNKTKNPDGSNDVFNVLDHSGSQSILELQAHGGDVYTCEIEERDELFNYILGFARLEWKALQR